MPPIVVGAISTVGMGDTTEDDNKKCALANDNTDKVEPIKSKVDAIAVIGEANGLQNKKFRRRVQFLPDGMLVRVREISPRRHISLSSESDETSSDSKSDSDETDSDESDSANDEADLQTSLQQESKTIVADTASLKPSPRNQETPNNVVSNNVKPAVSAKISEPQPPVSDPKQGSLPLRPKRSNSPKLTKRKIVSQKQILKTESNKSRERVKRMKSQKTQIPPKQPKSNSSIHKNETKNLTPRRPKSAPPNQQLTVRRSQLSTVSTSLAVIPRPLDSYKNHSIDRVTMAMQSLTMKNLHAVDEFMFPTRQISKLHLPFLQSIEKPMSSDNSFWSSYKGDFDCRNSEFQSCYRIQQQETNQRNLPSPQPTSNQRNIAWQMANLRPTETLQRTPSIAQLWDNDNEPHS